MTQMTLFTLGTAPAGWMPLARDLLHRSPPGVDLCLRAVSEWYRRAEAAAAAAGLALAAWVEALPEGDLMRSELATVAGDRKGSWGGLEPSICWTLPVLSTLYPRATFVVLVESPVQALAAELLARTDCKADEVLDQWTASARAILRHVHAHPGRCLVLNAAEALQDRSQAAVVCRERTGIALREPDEATPPPAGPDPLALYLAGLMAKRHAASANMFEELQAACVPLGDETPAPHEPPDLKAATDQLRLLTAARLTAERLGVEQVIAEEALRNASTERDAARNDAAEVLQRQHLQQEQLAAAQLEQQATAARQAALEVETAQLRQDLAQAGTALANGRLETEKLKTEVELARRTLQAAAEAEEALRGKLLAAEVSRETAHRHRDEMQRQLETARKANLELKDQVAQHARTLSERDSRIEEMQTAKANLAMAMQTLQQDRDQLQQTLDRATQEAEVTRSEAQMLRDQGATTASTLDQVRQQLQALLQDRDQLQQALDRATQEAEVTRSEAQLLRDQGATTASTLDQVRQQLQALLQDRDQLQQALDRATQEAEVTRSEAQLLRDQGTATGKALDQGKQQLKTLHKERDQLQQSLQQRLQAEQSQAARREEETRLLLSRLHDAHGEAARLQQALRTLDERLPYAAAARGAGMELGPVQMGALRDTPPHRELAFELPHWRRPGQAPASLALRLVEHNGHPGLVLFADGPPPLMGWQESSREGERPLSLFVPADADSRQRLARLTGSDWLLLQALMSALERHLRATGNAAPPGWLLVLQRLRAAIDSLPARPRHDRIEFSTLATAPGRDATEGLHMLLHGVDCAGVRQSRWGLYWWPAAGGGDIEWLLGERGCVEPALVSWPLQSDGRPAERMLIAAGGTGPRAERRRRWLDLPAQDLQLMRAVTAAVPDWLEAATGSGVVPAAQAATWQAAAQALAGRIDADLKLTLPRRVVQALRGVLH